MTRKASSASAFRHLLPAALVLLGSGLFYGVAFAAGVYSSPHNLSASGGRGEHAIAFPDETRVCVFCHVPHNATQPQLLWSRELPPADSYTPYESTTLKAQPGPGLPTGASRLCLSCHDGTIALAQFAGSRSGDLATMLGNPNLGWDLRNDHPISFPYADAVVAGAELVAPAALPSAVRLDRNGELQCTGCHDPHNNQYGNFLVVDNSVSGSPLCTTCHDKTGWVSAAHNPQQTPVLSAGCLHCHYAHNAPEPRRLLHSPLEENNCFLNCHDGSAGDTGSPDIRSIVQGTIYRHPVDLTTGIHDPAEIATPTAAPATTFHVECVDCHNPHQAQANASALPMSPAAGGPLKGVRLDADGNVATAEYEICFKCHAGGSAANFQGFSAPTPRRQLVEPDQQNRFADVNPSHHPVTANRHNKATASLKFEFQAGMQRIYCSDCHNSESGTRAGGSGANGPHGSIYPHILIDQYEMPAPADPRPPYSSTDYALCFRCHDENFVMISGTAFVNGFSNLHAKHVETENVPCFVCHDPHGTSLAAGAADAANAHLINFDLDYVDPTGTLLAQYQTLAAGTGSCTVACHGNATHTRAYAP